MLTVRLEPPRQRPAISRRSDPPTPGHPGRRAGRDALCWGWGGLLAALIAAGCGATPGPPANTLIYGRGGDANTLDPIHTDIGEAVKVLVNIYDTLVTYDDETLDLVPALATRWESAEDGLVWTFTLRDDVRFHDGTPLDAQAVVFSLERLIRDAHPDVHDAARPYAPSYRVIQQVRALGTHVVQLQLSSRSAVLLKNLAMFPASIVSPTAVRKYGKLFGQHPVGTGPFRLESWQRDEELVLAAFDDHWRGRPRVERVVFVPIPENAVRAARLRRGEIHIADNLPSSELERLAETRGIVLQSQPGMNVAYLTMQVEKPPLDQRAVRQAIAQAIDKRALVEVAYGGRAQPAVTLVPPTMWGHHDGLEDWPYDPAAARRLLAQAATEGGWSLPLRLQLLVMDQPRPYLQQPLQTAALIKDSLAPLGIEVEIVLSDLNRHFERLMRGEHQLGLAGWSSDNADPDNFLYTLLDEDHIAEIGNNLSRYRHPEVHRLLLAAQVELREEVRRQMYLQAQELIHQDVPVVPLAHTEVRIAQQARLRGYRLHPSSLVRLRLAYFAEPAP